MFVESRNHVLSDTGDKKKDWTPEGSKGLSIKLSYGDVSSTSGGGIVTDSEGLCIVLPRAGRYLLFHLHGGPSSGSPLSRTSRSKFAVDAKKPPFGTRAFDHLVYVAKFAQVNKGG